MSVGTGTPIKLVQEDGTRIELMATDLQIVTNRKVGQIPLPLSGSKRFGMDFNMNNCTIMASGIIVDDKTVKSSSLGGAKAKIDFSRAVTDESYGRAVLNPSLFSDGTITAATLATAYHEQFISLTNSAGTTFYIVFENDTGTDAVVTDGSTHIVKIFLQSITGYGTSDATWKTNFVSNLATVINSGSLTLSTGYASATKISEHFTATAVKGIDSQSSLALEIQAKDDATDISVVSPNVFQSTSAPSPRSLTKPQTVHFPIVTKFNRSIILDSLRQFSAGDKVQNLIGIVNNSNNKSAWGLQGIGSFISGLVNEGTASQIQQKRKKNQDYIKGIEIPFKSFANAPSGYDADVRIFHMPTGGTKEPDEKGATAALEPGQILDDGANDFVGIEGALQNLDINYAAGETVYNFTLTFLPIDFLL